METQDKLFKLDLSIQDERFDIDEMSYYRLYIALGESNLRVCVIDSLQNRCLLIEDYGFYKKQDIQELISSLNRIYDNDRYLKANFWQSVSIIFKGQSFSLVPQKLFDANHADKYIQFNSIENTSENQVLFAEQPAFEAVNVFQAKQKLVDWFKQTYRSREIDFYHQTLPFNEGIKAMGKSKRTNNLHIFVEGNYIITSVLKSNQLEFCNIFSYKTSKDFIYFVLFVMDEHRLDREQTEVTLYGNINQLAEVFKFLRTYINKVNINSEKPDWVSFSYFFDEAPLHYYFDLYSAHLCKSI